MTPRVAPEDDYAGQAKVLRNLAKITLVGETLATADRYPRLRAAGRSIPAISAISASVLPIADGTAPLGETAKLRPGVSDLSDLSAPSRICQGGLHSQGAVHPRGAVQRARRDRSRTQNCACACCGDREFFRTVWRLRNRRQVRAGVAPPIDGGAGDHRDKRT